ncbi:MAG: PAS domain S-box protein [Firmicutes bacterium]|nr:PAS domain S-box protein [Bacillota bacterium]
MLPLRPTTLYSIVQALGDAVVVIDEKGVAVFWNRAAERMFGYTHDECLGQPISPIIPSRMKAVYTEILRRFCTQQRVPFDGRPIETMACHRDGREIPVQLSITPWRQGKDRLLIGMYRDISKRRYYQKDARAARERFLLLAEQAQDVITFANCQGQLEYLSPAIEKVLGYQSEELLGKTVASIYHPDDLSQLDVIAEQVARGEDVTHFTCRVRHKAGHYVWIENTVKIVRNAKGEVVQVIDIGRDVTERKRLEQAIMQTEKLAMAGQLAAGIAHEIRNPMTVIKGFAQLMRPTIDDAHSRYMDMILGELERVDKVLSELLLLAKPQAVAMVPTVVAPLVEEVIALISPQAHLNNVMIFTDYLAFDALVFGEPNQLKQVFINVLLNAIEAMPEGGRTFITLREQDDCVVVEIGDEGKGISQARLTKLGEPFYTTKEKGTGLGLMVCRKIMELHQGSLEIVSQIGHGTTVQVILPLHHVGEIGAPMSTKNDGWVTLRDMTNVVMGG